MNIDEPFDIDNMDIEEQIDEQEELHQEEEGLADEIEEDEIDNANNDYKKARMVLNAKNLSNDLSIQCESFRNIYFFKKDNIEYKGYVIHKLDKNTYIFNVKKVKDREAKYKLKKINILQIKQLVNKYVK